MAAANPMAITTTPMCTTMPPLARPTKPLHPAATDRAGVAPADLEVRVGPPHREGQGPSGRRRGERAEAEGQQRLDPVHAGQHADHHRDHADRRGHGQAAAHHLDRGLAPREGRSHRHQEQQGQPHRDEEPVEVGGPDRHRRVGVERLVEQGEDRAQQDDEGEAHEEDVVGQKGPLPTDGRIDPSRGVEPVAPPGDESHPGRPPPSRRRTATAGRWWSRRTSGPTAPPPSG